MSRVVQTTEAQADALDALVNRAMGFPRAGLAVGAPLSPLLGMPASWNGTGPTPPGWTKRSSATFLLNASDAWLDMPDNVVAACASSGLLTGPEKAQVASAGAGRATVADPTQGGTRSPKPEASAAIEAAEAETERKP